MKQILKLTTFVFLSALLFQSCLKDDVTEINEQNKLKSLEFIEVPQGFDWKTSKDVEVEIAVSGAKSYSAKEKVTLYDEDPELNGVEIASGSVYAGSPFSTKISISQNINTLYAKYVAIDGSIEIVPMPIVDNKSEYAFGAGEMTTQISSKSVSMVSMDCNSNCDITITAKDKNITIPDGKYVCIPEGVTYKGNVNNFNGVLKVCGELDVNNLNINDAMLYVTSTGKVSIGTLNMNNDNSTIKIEEGAEVEISNSMNLKGYMENRGALDISAQVNLNSSATLINYNELIINKKKNCNINSNSVLVNYGYFESGKINQNSSSIVENYCTFIVHDDLYVNSDGYFKNIGGYLEVDETVKLNANTSELYLTEGSLFKCKDFEVNSGASMIGEGYLSTAIISKKLTVSNAKTYPAAKGSVEFSAGSLKIYSASEEDLVTDGAVMVKAGEYTNEFSDNTCDPINKSIANDDKDGDGVKDENDAFPEDETRAFISYFPSEDGTASAAFEDLWPAKGDFDYNDLVMDIKAAVISNADNDVVNIDMTFKVQAIGAEYENGFGFQIDNLSSVEIASVEGTNLEESYISTNANGTEAGQDKAVVIVSDNVYNLVTKTEGFFYKTVKDGATGTSKELAVSISFTEPVSFEDANPANFNYFLIKNMKRGTEVHFIDREPTLLADNELFGTIDDRTVKENNSYYKTANGLPWGILIHEQFDYPYELIDIVKAYNYIVPWAESGGESYQDWYQDKPGYRNEENIYK